MSNQSPTRYTVYNIRTYFSSQPGNLACCPVCGCSISPTTIKRSKSVSNDLSDDRLVSTHDFSHLYRCRDCEWWAVRESWAVQYIGLTHWVESDFLVIGDIDTEGMADRPSTPLDQISQLGDPLIVVIGDTWREAASWHQISQIEDLYSHAEPLPDHLGQLFIGDQRKRFTR